jgi:hypothetical protein
MRVCFTATSALAHALWTRLRGHLSGEQRDAGYTTETVIITALLVLMAIAVVAVISAKVISLAQGINLNP